VGAIPIFRGIALSLERMNKTLEVDRDNLMVTVGSGVITGELRREVEEYGPFYPISLASLDSYTLRGNVFLLNSLSQ
jgi:glycolate oxidase